MARQYVLVRQDGGHPTVEFLGLFAQSSAASEAAAGLAPGLEWEDVENPGGPLQIAEALGTHWERYAIVRLEEGALSDPPAAL